MMKKPIDSASFNDTESAVLEAALRDPEATNAEIAEATDTRITLVRDIRDEYEDTAELPDDAADAGDSIEVDVEDLNDAQLAVLKAAARDPSATNAGIAEATDNRITFVRDTRNRYEGQVDLDVEPVTDTDDSDETADDSDEIELSARQEEILTLAENDPELTNAEIAAETGARVTFVRDTRSKHADGGFEFGGTTADESRSADSSSDDVETVGDSLQERIQTLAADNPEWTYGEIAAEVDARVPFVRDTLADYNYSSGGGSETTADSGLPPGVNAGELADTEQAILELAQANPALTNAEIAEEAGTHVAVVRDIRAEHEPGKSTEYGGQGTIEAESNSDDDANTVSTGADGRAWDPGEPSDRQTEILRLGFSDPGATNAEIAAETGASIPLVRDTREAYDDLDQSDLDDDTDERTTTSGIETEPSEPTAVQQSILSVTAENPEATNAEIAAECDVRVTLVRDTRRTYDADSANDNTDAGDIDADSADDDNTETGEEDAERAVTAAEPEAGVSVGRLVALAVLLVLLIIVILSFN